MSLFRTLLIIVIIYFAVRFLTRYIFPLVMKKAVDKAQENMVNKMEEMYRKQNEKNEGDISIKSSKNKNRKNNDDGEYVDYEEVK